jgi:PPM family protein phosphatase
MNWETLSSPGGREVNQDAVGCRTAGERLCCALADGLGGHGGGELAAQLALSTMLDTFERAADCSSEGLFTCLKAANEAIVTAQGAHPMQSQMRTTAVLLIADARRAVWAHIGDSRLYHFRAGSVATRTKDHSVPQAMVAAGELRESDIRFHEDRSRLFRSLGTGGAFEPSVEQTPVELEPGDAFLLVSDGFWEHVYEREMEAELVKAATPAAWLEGMVERLRRRAAPDCDNYSAVAVFVGA